MTSGQGSEKPVDSVLADADDTPLTDVLLDQFAAYYTVAVLAVTALEEARRQRLARMLRPGPIRAVTENDLADPRGVIMEQIPARQRRVDPKPLRRTVNGERGVEPAFRVGDGHGDRDHRIVKLLPVEAEAVTANVVQFVAKPVCIDMRVRRQAVELQARQKRTPARARQACHVNLAAGGAVKRHMRADRERHPEGPVGFQPCRHSACRPVQAERS